jgi:hypothetical protein
MSNRFNNKTLLLIFAGLAVLFILTRLTRTGQGEKSMITELAVIDTSRISEISLYPVIETGQELRFTREGNLWRIGRGNNSAPANSQAVQSVLAEIRALEAQQLVSRDPNQWDEYQVTDSSGTRIVITEGSRVALDMIVGRFQYQPPPQGSYNTYGQNQVSGKTYVRLSGEDEVYAVDGFFALSVNQGFDRWRDNTLTRLNKNSLTRIHFDYPADSGYIAQKSASGWLVAGLPADSATMERYLNRISRTSFSQFADGFQPDGSPDFQLTLEGDQMGSVVVRAYAQADSSIILQSSMNPETWFRTGDSDRIREIFPGTSVLATEGT